ncbi:MAG TPA: hypothetical protein VFW75_12170 [Acetobacteraceae bacterium]|nr:hypothetical protein [Acetobacteraceae bacterium]
MAANAQNPSRDRTALPDYEETLQRTACRVLLDSGVPAEQVAATWERLRDLPLPLDLPSDEELDALSSPLLDSGARP